MKANMKAMSYHLFQVTRTTETGRKIMDKLMRPKALVGYLNRNIWDDGRIAERLTYELFTNGKTSFGADNNDVIEVTFA